jgi:hypothetical protein
MLHFGATGMWIRAVEKWAFSLKQGWAEIMWENFDFPPS